MAAPPLYRYLGDRLGRLSGSALVGQLCRAVLDARGKCIRGRNGSMLVEFASGRAVVLGRQLRKVAAEPALPAALPSPAQSVSSTSTAVEPPASSSVTSSSS